MKRSTALVVLLFFGCFTRALAEPNYCSVRAFQSMEIEAPSDGLNRLHAFRLGRVVLAGLAIGKSRVGAVEDLSDALGDASEQEKSCTWYFGNNNAEASQKFNYKYIIGAAVSMPPEQAANAFMDVVGRTFDSELPSFLSCARSAKYIAMGCDNQKHRGPTVFGMLLAYSGCTPEHAMEITNSFWGLNMNAQTRLEIIRQGFELGNSRPENRRAIQNLLLGGN